MFRDPAGFDPAGSLHRPGGSLHDTARRPSRDPATACEDLRPDLFLYAEGELADPSSLLRVRRHLRDCPSCEERLARHDALTRALLAGVLEDAPPVAGDDSRADRIMGLIRRLPRPSPRPRAPGCPTILPGRAREWPRAVASAAAVLMVGLLAFIVFTGIPRDSLEDRLAAPSSPAPGRETHLTALAGDRPLWVTIPRALDALPRDVPARLLGFHPDTRRSPDDRVVLEWMVEALIDARPSSRKRFFLVPEAGDILAVEIAPVAWLERPRAFPPIRLLLHSADAGRLIGGQPAYRVYTVSDPASLGAAVPEAALSAAPLFPRVVEGAAGLSHDREWVFPALWKN